MQHGDYTSWGGCDGPKRRDGLGDGGSGGADGKGGQKVDARDMKF